MIIVISIVIITQTPQWETIEYWWWWWELNWICTVFNHKCLWLKKSKQQQQQQIKTKQTTIMTTGEEKKINKKPMMIMILEISFFSFFLISQNYLLQLNWNLSCFKYHKQKNCFNCIIHKFKWGSLNRLTEFFLFLFGSGSISFKHMIDRSIVWRWW